MARGVNKLVALGNLGKDPETKATATGKSLTKFSLAVTTGSGEYEHTEWFNCVVFGTLADICQKYLKKGSKIYAEGSIKTRQWESEGEQKYFTEFQVSDVVFLSGKDDPAEGSPKGKTTPDKVKAKQKPAPAVDFDDDIPF